MNRPDIDAIEARANAATPGPWEIVNEPYSGLFSVVLGAWETNPAQRHHVLEYPRQADIEFIVAARTDVPAFCAYVRKLEVENAAFRDMRKWQRCKRHKFDPLEWACPKCMALAIGELERLRRREE